MTLPVAVLISGRGSNLRAIATAIDEGRCRASICAVVSDKSKAAGLEFARERHIPTEVVRLKDYDSRSAWSTALAERVASHEPSLVVLAGFMRVVADSFIERFPNRIINVHPSLLPAFPGAHGPRDALEAGVRVTGCTVHVVDAGVDTGPIIAQGAVPVLDTDDADSLHARIQRVEHLLLPRVVDAIASGRIRVDPELRIEDTPESASDFLLSLGATGGD